MIIKCKNAALTIMAAYSSWIVAEAVKASGVLAVVYMWYCDGYA